MSWFGKKRNIAIAIGAAVLAVVSLALIIYGVSTHEEPVLLKVCWSEGGEARYEAGAAEGNHGTCEGAEELVWPTEQMPLSVAAITAVSGSVLSESARSRTALDAAIRDINAQVGCEVLVSASSPDGASILARLGTPVVIAPGKDGSGKGKETIRSPLGSAIHHRSNTGDAWGVAKNHHKHSYRLHCDLHISANLGSERGEYLVAHHELLHCIGLAHDPGNPSSAIYPFTRDDTMWARMLAARITDADGAKLRALYCHRPGKPAEGFAVAAPESS